MIDLRAIAAGDRVTLSDLNGNLASGPVSSTDRALSVAAFGVAIPFARRDRNGNWQPLPQSPVRVTAHQPPLEFT